VIKRNVVYQHINLITKEIFYIGIGVNMKRPYSITNRSSFWKNEFNKYGRIVEILHINLDRKEACLLECFYIAKYGRRDLGLGPLVNMTDGGDGTIGRVPWNKGIKTGVPSPMRGLKTGIPSPKKGIKTGPSKKKGIKTGVPAWNSGLSKDEMLIYRKKKLNKQI